MRIYGFVLAIVMGLLLSGTHSSVQAKKKDDDASTTKFEKKQTRVRGRSADNSAKGEADDVTAEAVLRQMEREEDKHRRRVAKLERIREMLREKGNDQAVGQLDKVLAKENKRYDRALTRFSKRDKATAEKFRGILKDIDSGKGKRKEKGKGGHTDKDKSDRKHKNREKDKDDDSKKDDDDGNDEDKD